MNQRLVQVQTSDGASAPWPDHALVPAFDAGQLHPETPVSLDGGQSWQPARVVVQELRARGDDVVALVAPVHLEPWSVAAGYVALFSLLFFGGPVCFVAVLMAFDTGPKLVVRLGAVLVGALLGPLPVALLAWLSLRGIRRNPTYRGKGRAVFALVVAAVLALACLVALVGVFVR